MNTISKKRENNQSQNPQKYCWQADQTFPSIQRKNCTTRTPFDRQKRFLFKMVSEERFKVGIHFTDPYCSREHFFFFKKKNVLKMASKLKSLCKVRNSFFQWITSIILHKSQVEVLKPTSKWKFAPFGTCITSNSRERATLECSISTVSNLKTQGQI